jgi:TolB-like protein/DNA-binding winged helix-turn-helix (wHTH) protein/Tfp pilus assembly protein PilF
MAHPGWSTNTLNPSPDPTGYQVDDLTVDLAPRRVKRAGTIIPLKGLSFDLLVTLVRAAPNLLSFEQLSERVWPTLVISPETVVQRVKLLRGALDDDPQSPRYIEGVRGRGYRVVAEVRPLWERQGTSDSIVLPSLETKAEESPHVHAAIAIPEAASVNSAAATPSTAPRSTRVAPLRWVGGTLIVVGLLAASWEMIHHRGLSKPAEGTSVVVSPVIGSLAVLPLENLSGDKEQEYFAEGMTDALTTHLAQIGSLKVISRTSAIHFKGSKETLPQIGRELNVDAVVEGTVTRGDNRVRVTAQLVETSSDHNLWAKTYERDLQHVLALQDEIAQDVAEQVRVKLSPKERSLLMQVRPVDPEAYDATLKGWYWFNQFTPDGIAKALDYFQKAIAKDPNYALAYAGVAACFLPGIPDPKSREAAMKALALDPSLAQAHMSLAMMKFYDDWDWSGAEAEFKQATALNPNYAMAHSEYSSYLTAMGRLDEAMTEIEHARDLDPFSTLINFGLGQVLYHARRYDDALRENRRGLEMHPDETRFNSALYEAMSYVYEQKAMFAESFVAMQRSRSLANDPSGSALAEAYKTSGYRGYLLKEAQVLDQEANLNQANNPYAAHIYALLNDEAHAITALEMSYHERNVGILFMRTAPEFDSIRSSPGFRDLVRRIGFPPLPSDKN